MLARPRSAPPSGAGSATAPSALTVPQVLGSELCRDAVRNATATQAARGSRCPRPISLGSGRPQGRACGQAAPPSCTRARGPSGPALSSPSRRTDRRGRQVWGGWGAGTTEQSRARDEVKWETIPGEGRLKQGRGGQLRQDGGGGGPGSPHLPRHPTDGGCVRVATGRGGRREDTQVPEPMKCPLPAEPQGGHLTRTVPETSLPPRRPPGRAHYL